MSPCNLLDYNDWPKFTVTYRVYIYLVQPDATLITISLSYNEIQVVGNEAF